MESINSVKTLQKPLIDRDRQIEELESLCKKLNEESGNEQRIFGYNPNSNSILIYEYLAKHHYKPDFKLCLKSLKERIEKEGFNFLIKYDSFGTHSPVGSNFTYEEFFEKIKPETKFVEDTNFEDFIKRWIGKHGITKIEKSDKIINIYSTKKWMADTIHDEHLDKSNIPYLWHDITPQVKALIGQWGILDITNLDDPKGVVVKAEWFDHYFEISMRVFVREELAKLGLKLQDVKWSYFHFPISKTKIFFSSKIGKRIATSISAIALTALLGFNYDKIPTSLSPTIIHEGILERQEQKGNHIEVNTLFDNILIPSNIPEGKTKFVFEDKASFVLENNKISGIIPKGTKTRLVQGITGNYYFEVVK